MTKITNILNFSIQKLISKLKLGFPKRVRLIGRSSKFLLIGLLTIITTMVLNFSYSIPARSENAVKQNLTPKQLGKIIRKTERSWEYDFEDYFRNDFKNFSQNEKEIAKQLTKLSKTTGTNPAVLWAVPTPEQLYLLLITPGSNPVIKSVRTARGEALAEVVDNFDRSIRSSSKINSRAYLPSAKLLHKWLIEPIEPELKSAAIDTIMLCSGSGLRSFPFAALYDGEQFLIEKYSLVRLPAFNLTDISYEPDRSEKMEVLAMGASVFSDLPPLPGVEVEISTIVPKTLPGKAMLNRDFTVKNLRAQHDENAYDLIHLATHAEFNSGKPQNSYIQFGDTKVSLDKIDRLGLNDPPVDLLVLSACQTAVGNKQAEFGFAGLTLQAGVKTALASLWSIDDAGTVALMSEFYQNIASGSMKAMALRESQIAMLQGRVYLDEDRLRSSRGTVDLPPTLVKKQYDLSHPFYWAGFSLIGNPW